MAYRLGVDTGGTFVDVVLSTPAGELRLAKALSDPSDLAGAVIQGIAAAAETEGLSVEALLSDTDRIVHGSTVATNAILTRRGPSVALLTTEGFRDVLNLRRGVRDRPMDSRRQPPVPLIPRHRIFGVRERLDCEGRELAGLDSASLDDAIAAIEAEGIESVAVCFLFSFLDGAHEVDARERLAARLPGRHVSLSSEVLPQLGLYERVSTTAVNAFVSPSLGAYLERLADRLSGHGFRGALLLMQSNGGIASVDVGRRFGARSVLSGPAAAPVAAARLGALYGLRNVISVDMGGTSFDVCLINDGEPQLSSDGELAGFRIALSMLDIHTIGAGGGSIVGVDERGLLQVGPQSAGATPGPACYGRGGTRPTITDANVLLGYVAPDLFWGGKLTIDVGAAERAMQEHVAAPLGLDVVRAAAGAYQVVNENMVDAIREVSVRRGFDPRQFALVAAGGAGPLHVGALAQELDIPIVLIPRLASVFCALGGLLSDLRYERSTSLIAPLRRLELDAANATIARLREPLLEVLAADGVAAADTSLEVQVGLRYAGQFHEIEVPLAGAAFTPDSVADLAAEFHRRHESINGYQEPAHELDVITLRVVATGRTTPPAFADVRPDADDAAAAEAATAPERREIVWDGQRITVPVHRRGTLRPDSIVAGPAIVTEATTTLVVPPDFELWTDRLGNGVLYRAGTEVRSLIDRLAGAARAGARTEEVAASARP
jgi:N-methylhydantoinase A